MQFSCDICSPVRKHTMHTYSHVLGLLQAFTLSQDQTHLKIKVAWTKFSFSKTLKWMILDFLTEAKNSIEFAL
jgi:hypothetical protein